jgi:hypothetical protein
MINFHFSYFNKLSIFNLHFLHFINDKLKINSLKIFILL